MYFAFSWSLVLVSCVESAHIISEKEDVTEAGPGYWDGGLYTVELQRQKVPVGTRGNVFKTAYFGTISLGNPVGSQEFRVVFDTGSAHLVVPNVGCKSVACESHRQYNISKSEGAQDIDHDGSPVMNDRDRDMITINFGTGEVTGVFVKDRVCLGTPRDRKNNRTRSTRPSLNRTSRDATDLEVDMGPCVDMQIVAAVAMSDDPFKTFNFDGILGLGLEGLSQSPMFNFLHKLDMESTMSPIFSVSLAQEEDSAASEITFGGWKRERLSRDVVWTPVARQDMGYWQVPIHELRVGGVRLPLCRDGPCYGVVDTGTSLVAAPGAIVESLMSALRPHLKHALSPDGESCSPYNPDAVIEFVFDDGLTLELTPKDYARPMARARKEHEWSKETVKSTLCEPMFMSMDIPEPIGPNLFILGEPVFMKYLVVFDALKRRIGFGLNAKTEVQEPEWTGEMEVFEVFDDEIEETRNTPEIPNLSCGNRTCDWDDAWEKPSDALSVDALQPPMAWS